MSEARHDLIGHAGIVVRTVPHAGLGGTGARDEVRVRLLEPSAFLIVNEVFEGEIPVLRRGVEIFLVPGDLPGVDAADDGLALGPPLEDVPLPFQFHRSVRGHTLGQGDVDHLDRLTAYLLDERLVTDRLGGLAEQPGGLDVVTVGVVGVHDVPVIVAVEDQVLGGGIVKFRLEYVEEFEYRFLDLRIRPGEPEIGEALHHVDVGVHRLGGLGPAVHALGVGTAPVAVEHLDVALPGGVVRVLLQGEENLLRGLEAAEVARGAEMLREAVDAEGIGVGLLGAVAHRSFAVHRPIDPAVFPVDEMGLEVLRGPVGHILVSGNAVDAVRPGECPEDAGVEDGALVSGSRRAVVHHGAVEPSVGIYGVFHPERKDIVSEVRLYRLAEALYLRA